jgi:two-component system sensor histidine kinase/response regulator
VVDDSHSARVIASEMLVAMGFRVDAVASGPEAVELAESAALSGESFRVVLMDWKMSPWDGLETARRIQGDPSVSDKPVIVMMTAHGREDVMRQAESMGIKGFLLKPMSPSLLLNVLVDRVQDDKATPRLMARATIRTDRAHLLAGSSILVVDDNEINQMVAKEILEAAGAKVRLADNGEEALIAINEETPDAVLMDVQMPVMDGLEATTRLRQDSRFHSLPVLAMTAHALVEERERCMRAGMNDHVTKPIDPDVLVQTVAKYLRTEAVEVISAPPARETPARQMVEVELPFAVPGFAVEEALQRLSGNRRLLAELLKDFARDHKDYGSKLHAALDAGDLPGVRRLAHAVKGVAGNLALKNIQMSAGQLEDAAKNGDAGATPILAKALTAHIDAAVSALNEWSSASAAPIFAPERTPETIDRDVVEKKLKELDLLLAEGNLRADEAFADLSSLLGPEAQKEHEAVGEKIGGLDYTAARPALAKLARALDIDWQQETS